MTASQFVFSTRRKVKTGALEPTQTLVQLESYLTTHFQLVLCWRKCGGMPPFTRMPAWCGRENFPLLILAI